MVSLVVVIHRVLLTSLEATPLTLQRFLVGVDAAVDSSAPALSERLATTWPVTLKNRLHIVDGINVIL